MKGPPIWRPFRVLVEALDRSLNEYIFLPLTIPTMSSLWSSCVMLSNHLLIRSIDVRYSSVHRVRPRWDSAIAVIFVRSNRRFWLHPLHRQIARRNVPSTSTRSPTEFLPCGTEILPANDSMMSSCAGNKRTGICPENRDLNLGR